MVTLEKKVLINLEEIREDLKLRTNVRELLSQNHTPLDIVRYYDGVIDTYKLLLKGRYIVK